MPRAVSYSYYLIKIQAHENRLRKNCEIFLLFVLFTNPSLIERYAGASVEGKWKPIVEFFPLFPAISSKKLAETALFMKEVFKIAVITFWNKLGLSWAKVICWLGFGCIFWFPFVTLHWFIKIWQQLLIAEEAGEGSAEWHSLYYWGHGEGPWETMRRVTRGRGEGLPETDDKGCKSHFLETQGF